MTGKIPVGKEKKWKNLAEIKPMGKNLAGKNPRGIDLAPSFWLFLMTFCMHTNL